MNRSKVSAPFFLLMGLSCLAWSWAGTTFEDIGAQQGIGPYTMAPGMGGGIAAADFDNDGDIDLFVPTAEGVPNQLYRNLTVEGGSQRFEEIAAQVGLASTLRSRSALWLDANGDGLLDLVVAGDCFQTDCAPDPSFLRLYQQSGSGLFEDVTAASGLADDPALRRDWRHRGGLSAGDIDGDGDPDLFVTNWLGGVQLFRNLGDGRFEDLSPQLGPISVPTMGVGPWQAVFHDFNRDGLQDIFVAVDFSENYLLSQLPNGRFEDIAASTAVDRAWNGMGVSLGDIDNDGDLDLYVTNISDDFFGELRHSNLYQNQRNSGPLRFDEVSEQMGVDNVAWGWGATFFDADNDGWLDLAVTNGFQTSVDQSRFFFNRGVQPTAFREASQEVGFDDMDWGSGLVAIDMDRDGDLDLVQTCSNGPLRVLRNQLTTPDRGYLVIKPRRADGYRLPLGALVRVDVNGTQLLRLITAGTSFMSQEPAEAFFGLGNATQVDRVTVIWPDGGRTILEQVGANQVLTVMDSTPCFIEEDRLLSLTSWPKRHDLLYLVDLGNRPCSAPRTQQP